ncbi:type I restriction endonuclease subunit R [Mycoplasmopsis gallopavonis]|uniref:Type I restriction enzyme endonuclease subunit n=1 Tax=Mycoplasmopsis gallopavonis TaxID=76629 RepID=A0A449AYU7_9BACT|nr:type I restriction endonuclease subunit R [Mycoplasmopsis gallopavonis]RIV16880.1 type I restriction endonuclease subunit R [Mycoplasmopsis gallopavonis]VEU72662.1 Type I restriction enzyme EcoR124II R protein [Mycoplasmopsis gallopavonis]
MNLEMLKNLALEIKEKYQTVIEQYSENPNNQAFWSSEEKMENALISELQKNGYEYLVGVDNYQAFLKNLRKQLEKLNNFQFSEHEWERFCSQYLLNKIETSVLATNKFHEDYYYDLLLDSGERKNIYIINRQTKDNWKRLSPNSFQVINQYKVTKGSLNTALRYDVTILINGLPLVHIELKKPSSSINVQNWDQLHEAFNQIARYHTQGFSVKESQLFNFVQIFIVSNGNSTKYFSNSVMERAKSESKDSRKNSITKNNNSEVRSKNKYQGSFQFTTFWTDQKNNKIKNLFDFARTFLKPDTLFNIITKYSIWESKKNLIIMRPYQIAATEKLLEKIQFAIQSKKIDDIQDKDKRLGGYVWHTTGSGKTVTSFKSSQLACQMEGVDKVIFVVDRKDLDHQTVEEFKKFGDHAIEPTKNAYDLEKALKSTEKDKTIVTTIQKMNIILRNNENLDIFKKRVIFIFDECHRSQFGEMNAKIREKFEKHILFGFTGTPIFVDEKDSVATKLKSTEFVFGEKLHSYNIIDAIKDGNVLRFHIIKKSTFSVDENTPDIKVEAVDDKKIIHSPERIEKIVRDIIQNFPILTNNQNREFLELSKQDQNILSKAVNFNQKTKSGFNGILAVQNIDLAKIYYQTFKRIQQEVEPERRLKIAIIYSYAPNGEKQDLFDEENPLNWENLNASDQSFLKQAMKDYGQMFGGTYTINEAKDFANYHTNISKRMKETEIDILIVVNMFLTGFDAKRLNTLWVDKELRKHGLIQAFSRTNRIYNDTKPYGNIVTYRNITKEIEESFSIFANAENGDKEIQIPNYKEITEGYVNFNGEWVEGFFTNWEKLLKEFPSTELALFENNKELENKFSELYSQIYYQQFLLETFVEYKKFKEENKEQSAKYLRLYKDLYERYKTNNIKNKIDPTDYVHFQVDLIENQKTSIESLENLVANFMVEKSIETKASIKKLVDRLLEFESENQPLKEILLRLTEKFNGISSFEINKVEDAIEIIHENVIKKLQDDINNIIHKYSLIKENTWEYIRASFNNSEIETVGEKVSQLRKKKLFGKPQNTFSDFEIIQELAKTIEYYWETLSIEEIEDLYKQEIEQNPQ